MCIGADRMVSWGANVQMGAASAGGRVSCRTSVLTVVRRVMCERCGGWSHPWTPPAGTRLDSLHRRGSARLWERAVLVAAGFEQAVAGAMGLRRLGGHGLAEDVAGGGRCAGACCAWGEAEG